VHEVVVQGLNVPARWVRAGARRRDGRHCVELLEESDFVALQTQVRGVVLDDLVHYRVGGRVHAAAVHGRERAATEARLQGVRVLRRLDRVACVVLQVLLSVREGERKGSGRSAHCGSAASVSGECARGECARGQWSCLLVARLKVCSIAEKAAVPAYVGLLGEWRMVVK